MEGEALGVDVEVDDEGLVTVHLNRIKGAKRGAGAPRMSHRRLASINS